ncbi:GFA family protein [Pseudoalteromonas sp. T1lg23B]|uniref:GFA family protein n=1 Tax=Pseudoalteromonas sp. T1lg23B TaxID=2077097 RepID=UPI000CF6713B|nr:GFA family protein [Pseudoalteromonas sp. T1lg23B]
MYKASCLCGTIQLRITGKISDIIHCHCSLCRKSTGTAFATNGFVNRDEVHVISGQDAIKYFEFKPGRKRHFCVHCASPLFSSNADLPSKLRIRLGILDSDIEERPISHNFVTSKANWEDLDATLPRYEGFEPSRGKV